MQFDLRPQDLGVSGKTAEKLVNGRGVAALAADEELVEDQVERRLGVGRDRVMAPQVRLGGYSLAQPPALR